MAPVRQRNSLTILLVEDDPLVASAIHEVLSSAGLAIADTVSSAEEALSVAAENLFGLALVDIGLPGSLDGIDLACLLRDKHSVPTIFLSGMTDAETIARALSATPAGFLKKPFRPAQVFNAIEDAFRGHAGVKKPMMH